MKARSSARPGPDAERDAGSMLGRAPEQARLEALLQSDTPVVVVGEAGVGKTTLARAAIRATGRAGLEGGGFGMLAWVPYLGLERALGRSLEGADATFAADVVMRAVGAGVLLLDDLQWVDPESRAVVGHVAGRIGLLACVRRGDPAADEALASLPASFQQLELEPLDEASASELARRARPALSLDAAQRVARRAGGNPLLIQELAAGGEEAANLRAAIRSRLAPLQDATREAMRLLAVAGRPMPAPALGSGAGALVSSGLAVLDRDGTIRVRHDLLASAVLEDMSDEERRAVHRRLARLLRDAGERARHHAAAGERALARRRALEAAAAASTHGEKAAHLELAASLATGAAGVTLRVEAANALNDGLEPRRALDLLGDLRGAMAADVALVEARALRLEYELAGARDALARAHSSAGATGTSTAADGAVLVRLALEDARLAVSELRPAEEALALARLAHDLAGRHGVHGEAARAVVGSARLLGGDLGGTDDLQVAMQQALDTGKLPLGLEIGSQLAFALLRGGRHAEGRALVGRLADEARDARLGEWVWQMAFWASGFAWHGGDFAGATTVWQRFDVASPDEAGADWYEVQALGDLGRLDEARIRADRALQRAKPGEYELGEALWLSADVAVHAGRWLDAIRYADRHAREVPNAHQRVFVELSGAWAAYELGRPATWPRHSGSMPVMRGGPIELEGIRALAEGRHEDAVTKFDEAVDAWAGGHARGELRSRWAGAESLRLGGRTDDAKRRLLSLEERLESVSHVPLLARTRRSLRRAGVRRSATRAAPTDSFLSAREREVLEMNGRGLRDAEIATQLGVSRWAVVRSAESAAAKLGAATRAEAVSRVVAL
jgi:DNA-binding CsgD family transcriptional regulator/tetratricopeptide (TPR) repeat protein